MLEGLNSLDFSSTSGDSALLSVQLDCCVIPLRNNFKLIQTTDFFYPLVDNPYTMGWITCCNVLSDIYAMGVVDCDNMLLLLGVPQNMNKDERAVSFKLLMQGFRDCASKAGTFIRGGQTVLSPWLMVGGVATSVCTDSEFIMPTQLAQGDVVVLTKPLGTQVAVNVHQWMTDEHKLWKENVESTLTPNYIQELFHAAVMSMCQLNRSAARLMHQFKVHGCTDVTGFGILGHADNLVKVQSVNNLAIRIHTLPCLSGAVQLSNLLNDRFKLMQGQCPETSGGLLVALPADKAQSYCQSVQLATGSPSWIVGDVIESESGCAVLANELRIVEVEHDTIPNADQQLN